MMAFNHFNLFLYFIFLKELFEGIDKSIKRLRLNFKILVLNDA